MIHTKQIHPLTEFLRNSKAFTERIDQERQPVGLTVNGKVKLVVMDSETFEELSAIQDRERFLAAVDEGVQAVKEGKVMSLNEFDQKMRDEFEIPR